MEFGQTRPLERGKPLEILSGQTVEKVDFSLPRGSVLTGRVVDEFGEPVAEVQVMPMRYHFMQGRRRLTPTGRSSTTNDIGEFRVFGLPPGQYYVSATMRTFTVGDSGDSDDRTGYAPTYYPGTPNVAEAQRVTVGLGQTLSNINMALIATRTANVSGTAIDSQGRPLSSGTVLAMEHNSRFFSAFQPTVRSSRTAASPCQASHQVSTRCARTRKAMRLCPSSDQDGRFIVRSLPPGRYYAVALDFVDPDESSDPEFLERIFPKATTLSLGDGETKTLDLKLNSAS